MNVSIEIDAEKKDQWMIFLNEEPWRSIHSSVFGKKPQINTSCNTVDDFTSWFFDYEYRLGLQYAYKRLSVKGYLSMELTSKLKEKKVSQKNINKIILECTRLGFLNDALWLENYIRACVARKMGPQAIVAKLRRKGFTADAATNAVAKLDVDQRQIIKKLLETKYRNKHLDEYRERQKVIGSLMRKGFSYEDIEAALL